MKKILASLALAGLAGGAFAGVAMADHPGDDDLLGGAVPIGELRSDGASYLVAQGNEGSIDGYIGVDANDEGVVVAQCGHYEQPDDSLLLNLTSGEQPEAACVTG